MKSYLSLSLRISFQLYLPNNNNDDDNFRVVIVAISVAATDANIIATTFYPINCAHASFNRNDFQLIGLMHTHTINISISKHLSNTNETNRMILFRNWHFLYNIWNIQFGFVNWEIIIYILYMCISLIMFNSQLSIS